MQDIIYVPLPNSNMISYHSPVDDSIVGKHAMVSCITHVTIWTSIVKSIIKRVSADTESEKWIDMTLLLWNGVTKIVCMLMIPEKGDCITSILYKCMHA